MDKKISLPRLTQNAFQSLQMIVIITAGVGDASGVLWIEPRDVIIHPTICRIAIQLVQHVNSSEVEKITGKANRVVTEYCVLK